MKIKTIIGIILLIIGICSALYFYSFGNTCGVAFCQVGAAFGVLFISLPIIALGITFLLFSFSIVGGGLASIAILILALGIFLDYRPFSLISTSAFGFFGIGIIYAIVEGLIKLFKNKK